MYQSSGADLESKKVLALHVIFPICQLSAYMICIKPTIITIQNDANAMLCCCKVIVSTVCVILYFTYCRLRTVGNYSCHAFSTMS